MTDDTGAVSDYKKTMEKVISEALINGESSIMIIDANEVSKFKEQLRIAVEALTDIAAHLSKVAAPPLLEYVIAYEALEKIKAVK